MSKRLNFAKILKDAFSGALRDGLDKYSLETAVRSLKSTRPNGISSEDLNKVERAILAKLAPQK